MQNHTDRPRRPGIRAVALGFPSILRTNQYWKQRYPDLVARAEHFGLAKIWLRRGKDPNSLFEQTMDPYRSDPFLGAVERRIRAPEESALSMELTAVRGALAAASLQPDDIDLTLVSSFVSDRFGVGNAAYLAEALELTNPALNFESACSGSLVGLQLASSLVQGGSTNRVMVVVSTSNSVQVRDDDSIGWFVGDGAAAFIVEASNAAGEVLGSHVVNSVDTNDMFVIKSVPEGECDTRLETLGTPRTGSIARDTAEPYLHEAVGGALEQAGVDIEDIDFFVFNTPTAWYAEFCARALGIGTDRYHSVYPRYANIGAALMPATLYHAIDEGKVKPGDRVLLYSIGSTSTAAAIVIRLGDVALGPHPTPPPMPDADWQEQAPATPTKLRSIAAVPDHLQPTARRRHRGRTTTGEAKAFASSIWRSADEVPAVVFAALERPEAISQETLSKPFSFEHDIDVGDGRHVFVRERFTLRSMLRSPRRAVVLLPGPISRESIYEIDVDGYRLQSELAQQGYFVYAMEYLGTGRSSMPEDGLALTQDTMVQQVHLVVKSVRQLRWLPPVDLLGESNGATVAAEVAADDESIRSCVLSAILYRKGTIKFRHVFQDPKFVSYLRARPGGYLRVSSDYYANILAHSPPDVSRVVLRTQPGKFAVAPLLEPLRLPWYDPSKARVPALILQGAKDNVATPSDVHDFGRDYGSRGGGRAQVLVLDDAHHIPRMEDMATANRWKQAVFEFLATGIANT